MGDFVLKQVQVLHKSAHSDDQEVRRARDEGSFYSVAHEWVGPCNWTEYTIAEYEARDERLTFSKFVLLVLLREDSVLKFRFVMNFRNFLQVAGGKITFGFLFVFKDSSFLQLFLG